MTPLVSVVIPCYKQGHFLAGAIDSALRQSYARVEVIVVNDGSDDNTDTVAQAYQGRIVYISQRNKGLPGARNTGIDAATGTYLHFLDADDLLHPEAIQRLVEASQNRTDVLCVMGLRLFETEDGPYEEILPPTTSPDVRLLTHNLSSPHGFLSPRKAVIECGKFDTRLKSCEDWDLWLRLLVAGLQIIPLNFVGAYYRQHPNSMSRNKARMATTSALVLHRALREVRSNTGLLKRIGGNQEELIQSIRERLTEELLTAAYLHREQGRYWASFSAYVRSLLFGIKTIEATFGIAKLAPHRLTHLRL